MATTDENGRRVIPDDDPAAVTKDPAAKPRKPRAKDAEPNRSKDPQELAADIEKTREELAETLDAIAEKVSPKRVAKRTTKKVTTAVKETASSARDKVSGGARSDTSWAPEPGPLSVEEAALASTSTLPATSPVEVPALATTTYAGPQVTPPPAGAMSTYTSSGSLIKPEYVAAGVVAALIAWFLVRRHRR